MLLNIFFYIIFILVDCECKNIVINDMHNKAQGFPSYTLIIINIDFDNYKTNGECFRNIK